MILNYRAKNYTSERTIVPWTVIFYLDVSESVVGRPGSVIAVASWAL